MAFGPRSPVSTTPNFRFKPSSPMPRIGFRVDPNRIFFDRQAVVDAVGRARAIAMGKSANRIKLIARRSMRYANKSFSQQLAEISAGKRKRFTKIKGPSPPGRPPRAIRPHPWVRKFTFASFDRRTQSAVIGPEWSARGGGTGAPRILEHGGRTRKKKNPRRIRRVLGGSGEIRLGGRVSRSTKQGVTYGKLTTTRMVARANVLNEELYGPETVGGGTQLPRPFMRPALIKEVPNMASRWAASVGP